MCHVHLHIFAYYLIESAFRHGFDKPQILHQIFCTTKQRSILPNGLRTNLSGKVVESTKEISVNLLQALYRSWFHAVEQTTLNKGVGFLLALSVNGVIAIGKPFKKLTGAVVGIVVCNRLNTIGIKRIGKTLFTIRSLKFEVVREIMGTVLVIISSYRSVKERRQPVICR